MSNKYLIYLSLISLLLLTSCTDQHRKVQSESSNSISNYIEEVDTSEYSMIETSIINNTNDLTATTTSSQSLTDSTELPDDLKYLNYKGTFCINDDIIDVNDDVIECLNNDSMEYYISFDMIKKYWDDNLVLRADGCIFLQNNIEISIINNNLTAYNELFGTIVERPCSIIQINQKYYIDISTIKDILGIKCNYKIVNDSEEYMRNIKVCDFKYETFPEFKYIEKSEGITNTFSYNEGNKIDEIPNTVPIYISNSGIYYYKSNNLYYAEYNGMYYQLTISKYESKDVPK